MQSNSLREDSMDEKTLAREELIGLLVKIKECKDPVWIGKSGLVIDETKNTFLIEIKNEKKMITKKAATFEDAADQAVEALRRQVKKHKEKLRSK